MHEESVTISVSIPSRLLAQVELLKGKNQNEKLVKCIRTGYECLKVKE